MKRIVLILALAVGLTWTTAAQAYHPNTAGRAASTYGSAFGSAICNCGYGNDAQINVKWQGNTVCSTTSRSSDGYWQCSMNLLSGRTYTVYGTKYAPNCWAYSGSKSWYSADRTVSGWADGPESFYMNAYARWC